MKKILVSLFSLAAWAVMAADTSVIDSGCTNLVAANATETLCMGNSIPLGGHSAIGMQVKFAGSAAGTTAVIYTLARSLDNSVWETTPKITAYFAQNGLTAVVGYTNLVVGELGAAGYIKLVSIQNQDGDANLTNHTVKFIIKKGL